MHKECMHVQFKNIKRSGVPAIERIEPFYFEELPHHRGIIIPGHNQQRSLTLTINAHQLQIPATMARNIQGKCECNTNIGQENYAIPTKAFRIYLARKEFKYIIQDISPGYQPYL